MAQRTTDILLVDDDARNLDALEVVLEDPAYRLLRAQDADGALKMLLDNDVAAIVLDIKMPGTDGFELAHMIKATKRYRRIPILFLTAHHLEDEDVITGYGTGAVDYMTKPLNPKIVRHKVAVFVELFRKTRALAELNDRLEERVRDRTAELRRSEAALRETDAKKDEFIAVLAHELRNPLTPLRFGLDLLARQRGADTSPFVAKTLQTMSHQLDYMVRLIDDLLDISRISRGTIELRKQRTDLGSVVQAAIDMNRPALEQRKHTLSLAVDGGLCTVGDPTRIAQVVGNLLHNAAKFTAPGGQIQLSLTDENERAVIRVTDSGEGLAPEDVERAFGMFARIQRSDPAAEQGLGIGLALGRQLAELHGGTLTAASDGPGRGACFTLTLPLSRSGVAHPAKPVAQPREVVPLDIVLIEDREESVFTILAWLTEMGHRVSVAKTGREGVHLVAEKRPALVLCDIGLPELDGVEVCRLVRKLALDKQPLMVALTGWGRELDRSRTADAGFDHHLVKPVDVEALRRVLASVPAAG